MPVAESGAAAAASSGRCVFANTSPWPGSTTFQPNEPSEKRANAIALATGSAPLMRRASPSSESWSSTFFETADSGPRT